MKQPEEIQHNALVRLISLAAKYSPQLIVPIMALGAVLASPSVISGEPWVDTLLAILGGVGVEAFGILLERASNSDITNKELLRELTNLIDIDRLENALQDQTVRKNVARLIERQERSHNLISTKLDTGVHTIVLAQLDALQVLKDEHRAIFLQGERNHQETMGAIKDIQGQLEGKIQEQREVRDLLSEKLARFSLADVAGKAFGVSELTENLSRPPDFKQPFGVATHYVILTALPISPITIPARDVLKVAKDLLKPEHWYSPRSGEMPPRYWPRKIFKIPQRQFARHNALCWEDKVDVADKVFSRLMITGGADVAFAAAQDFVWHLKNGLTAFRIGPILATGWKFSGLVAQLYQDIGYKRESGIYIGLVNTAGSHLGGFADNWLEPSGADYWRDVAIARNDYDWSCHAPNILVHEIVNLPLMTPKVQPDFIRAFGEEIFLLYNHDVPRCFEKATGLIPERYY